MMVKNHSKSSDTAFFDFGHNDLGHEDLWKIAIVSSCLLPTLHSSFLLPTPKSNIIIATKM